jgi:uncharacterized YccA/Bax inhibitor family protein
MKSSNPALKLDHGLFSHSLSKDEQMTIQGTVNKTGLLLLIVLIGSAISWGASNPTLWIMVGSIGGLVMALVTIFKKEWAPTTAPIYAFLEGLFLGAMSSLFEASYPGIAIQATGLTFGTLAGMLVAYKSGTIQASENFKLGVVAATGGIFLFYLGSFIFSLLGFGMPSVFGNGLIGIGFSLFVVVIAALNLVLDFDFIEQSANRGAPKYLEWYGAFGLMVTLIWLYIEILHLLAKLQSRD